MPVNTTPDRYSKVFDTSHLQADLRARSVRGAAATLALQLVRAGTQGLSVVVLARLLTPEDFGVFGKVVAITSFLALLRNLGFVVATVQSPSITHQQASNLFWVNFVVSLGLALVVLGAAPLLGTFFADPRVVPVACALSALVFLGGLQNLHHAILRRQMRFALWSTIDVAATASGVVAGITCALFGCGYWALVIIQVVSQTATMLAATAYSGWLPTWPRRDTGTLPLLGFGSNMMGFNLVQFAGRNVDNIVIGKYVGDAALGAYVQAYSLLLLPMKLVFGPVAQVAVPMLSRVAEDRNRLRRAYVQLVGRLSFLTILPVALLVATGDWVVLVALGPQWSGAGVLFSVLGAAGLFQAVSDSSDWLFTATGRSWLLFRMGLVRALFMMAGIALGLYLGGVLGVAWGVTLAMIVGVLPLQMACMHRYTPVTLSHMFGAVWPGALGGAAILGAVHLLRRFVPSLDTFTGLLAATVTAMLVIAMLAILPPFRKALLATIEFRTVLRGT